MIEALTNHLWQSTAFALIAAGLALTFRHDTAHVRFGIWLTASLKFMLPFAPLIVLGEALTWKTAAPVPAAAVLQQIAQPGSFLSLGAVPLPAHAPASGAWSFWPLLLMTGWLIGSLMLCSRRALQWLQLRAIVRAATPFDIEAPIQVLVTQTTLEPGIFGIVHPVLLLPAGLTKQLAPQQLDAIVAHELCHWRRRDNLTAALHMVVETLFWFHPLVWWLGGRLLTERERACDETVVQSGKDREIYAGSILQVCQLCIEPPLPCVSAVSGGTLRKRIEEIMTHHVGSKLPLAKRCLLIAAAAGTLALPLAIGLTGSALAQAPGTLASEGTAIKHYKSAQWGFELDIPKRWNSFPANPGNSPNEVIRFESVENGTQLLIVFRNPNDPSVGVKTVADNMEQTLAKNGFSNFVFNERQIGSKQLVTLDFDRPMPDGGTWSCRHYLFINGTLMYVLGFGTTKGGAMLDQYDRMATSFVATEPGA